VSALLSDPRMSERERVCARNWLAAAIDAEDPDLTAFWRNEGLAARLARVAPGEEMAEPPVPEPKPRKETCDHCGRPKHGTPYECLL
jgi:hypothetical protein